jgi:two-component system, NarL family, nitrate/nitrite response regulator NarL
LKEGGGTRRTQAIASKPYSSSLGIVLIDPLHVARAGLKLFLEEQSDMLVMAEAGTAEQGLLAIRNLRRKTRVVVLVSLGIPGGHDSFWLIRTIREAFPTLVILALGANVDGMVVSRALFTGADGYLDKGLEPPVFLDGLRRAADGDVILSNMPRDWLGAIADGLERQREAPALTAREREVLSVAVEGLTARAIGKRLGLRERTVTTHLGRIYHKLGVPGRVGAVRAAARVGLVTIHPFD